MDRPFLIRHRTAVVASFAVVCAAFLPGLTRLGTDNSPAVFFVRGSAAVERYRAFQDFFGNDTMVRLVVAGDVWSDEGLRWLGDLETGAAGVAGVSRVSGPLRLTGGEPAASPESLRRELLVSPLAHSLGWIDDDGELVTLPVMLDPASAAERRSALAALESLADRAPPGIRTRVVGQPVLNRALDASAREIQQRYFPALAVFAVALLLAFVRDLRSLAVPLAFVAGCEVVVLGAMGFAGVRLNLVLAVLPPLLFAITLATAIHVLLRFRHHLAAGAGSRAEAVVATFRDKGWSVLWTGVTTLVGFAALAISPVGPVRSLGLWAGLGLGLMTAAALAVYPALLVGAASRCPQDLHRSLRGDGRALERHAERLGRRLGESVCRHRRTVILAAAACAVLAALGLPRIRIESNALRYLPSRHPVRVSFEDLESRGVGLATVETLITLSHEETFRAAESVAGLVDVAFEIEAFEGAARVFGALSAGTVLDTASRRVPRARQGVLDELLARGELASWIGPERRTARLSVFVETVGYDELEPLLVRIRSAAQDRFPNAAIELTGEYPLLLETQRYLLSTLGWSLSVTLIVIAVVLRLLLPGSRLTLLALLPNLWPVLGILGLMGWTGVPLDIATVMVASIVLGLAVDDSIHTLGHFRRLAPHQGARQAVATTLGATAPAYLLTGLILIGGFGVCVLSDFAPTARFGLLSSVAIFLAVLGDLFLLPALLSLTPSSTVEQL